MAWLLISISLVAASAHAQDAHKDQAIRHAAKVAPPTVSPAKKSASHLKAESAVASQPKIRVTPLQAKRWLQPTEKEFVLRIHGKPVTLTGFIPETIQHGNLLRPLNLWAPLDRHDRGRVAVDPITSKPVGFRLFAINF